MPQWQLSRHATARLDVTCLLLWALAARGSAILNRDRVDLGLSTRKLHRAAVHLVLPTHRALRAPTDPHIGSASTLSDGSLLGDQRTVEARAIARNDLDDLHCQPPRPVDLQ